MYIDGTGKETTQVYCSITIPDSVKTVTQVPISAHLSYLYEQSLAKKITIRHVS